MSIQAVARAAGVSVATVSRVFNFPDRVRPATRERVQGVAQRLGYRPNESARTLRTQRSNVIGVVLPTLLNPVFVECLVGLAAGADAAGYSILPMTSDYRVAQEERAVDHLLARGVDGVVLVVANPAKSLALKKLRAADVPYVLAYNRHPRHPCVSVDSEAAVATLVRALHERGHARIAMVMGDQAASDRSLQRWRGFERGMAGCGLAAGAPVEVSFTDGAIPQLVALLGQPQRPTALVCSNDLLALRALRAAHEAGLAVPRELSVAGFDGIALGCDITPILATVVQPSQDIGRSAVGLLANALAHGTPLTAEASLTPLFSLRYGETIARAPAPRPPL